MAITNGIDKKNFFVIKLIIKTDFFKNNIKTK